MNLPGSRLRRLASRLVSTGAMRRIIDPAVADLQAEYFDARSTGRIWSSRWLRVIGTLAILRCALQCTGNDMWSAFLHPSDGDRRERTRLVLSSLAVCAGVILLLAGLPGYRFLQNAEPGQHWLVAFLVPQALPLTLPIAVALGFAVAAGGSRVSRHVALSALAIGVAFSASSFAVTGWIAPAANQAFRVATAPANASLRRGTNELSIGELRAQLELGRPPAPGHRSVLPAAEQGRPTIDDVAEALRKRYRTNEFSYYRRYALPCAPIVLTLLMLSFRARMSPERRLRGITALAACGAYYGLMFAGETAIRVEASPVIAGAWLPNVMLLFLAFAVVVLPRRTSSRVV